MTTAELLEQYRDYNPNANISSLNKSERQLYVGNIPPNVKSEKLVVMLNDALKEIGRDANLFQDSMAVIGSWIANDGHYAFVDFRSAEEATQGFVLNQIALVDGVYLKVGRPKNSSGIVPTNEELLCGDPNFNPTVTTATVTGKKGTSSSLVAQALKQSRLLEQNKMTKIDYTSRLDISNFPRSHTEDTIRDFCGEFGEVKDVELVTDENGGFDGRAYVDFENEFHC